MEKKCLMSKGHIDKYIIFALIAGIIKCFVSIMVYKFKDYAKYNQHPLINGFNASIGMSLSIIPFIIVKIKSHREIKNKNKITQTQSLKETKKEISGGDLNYLEKYDKKKLRTQKFLILLACAFLDFAQKFLRFFFQKSIIHNIWIFNICFIILFDYLILKAKLYKHQYISFIIIVALRIAVIIIRLYDVKDKIVINLVLCLCIEIIYSLSIVLSKFLMDYRSCTPYEVTFYEGIFALIVNSILLAIFTCTPIKDEDGKLKELLRLTDYEGKKYIDHFIAAFKFMSVGEVFFFILSAFNRLISNLFGHIVVKHYTSSHKILILILGEIGLAFKEEHGWKEIVQFVLFCLTLFILLIFTEIIEINACDLEKNTRKNIELRESMEEEDDDENYDMNGNIIHNKSRFTTKIEMDGFEIDLKTQSRSSKARKTDRNSDFTEEDKTIN